MEFSGDIAVDTFPPRTETNFGVVKLKFAIGYIGIGENNVPVFFESKGWVWYWQDLVATRLFYYVLLF